MRWPSTQIRSFHGALWLTGLVLSGLLSARAERLPLKAYTVADGLPNNVINKIVRDSRGFLWFCTEEGLSRFDGYSFRNYGVEQGLPHAIVNDFLETSKGELWANLEQYAAPDNENSPLSRERRRKPESLFGSE